MARARRTPAKRIKPGRPIFCSFCSKGSESVAALVAGPAVFICNECVALAGKILNGEAPEGPIPIWEKLPTEHLLAMLGPTAAVVDAASESLKMHVDMLRGRDVKWAAIGKALGVSRQAAWERFS